MFPAFAFVSRLVARRAAAIAFACFFLATAVGAAPAITLTPFHATGIYALGEKAGWTVTLADDSSPAQSTPANTAFSFAIKKNNLAVVKSGSVAFESGRATIEFACDEPAMLTLQISSPEGGKPILAGAAVAPEKLQPTAARPADFDAFWKAKLEMLRGIPEGAVVTPGESDRAGVEYATIRLNNIGGAHVFGQLAKPAREGKFPALLILQWASPPYPLQKAWVTERAAEGWLALNVEPHDVPGDMPQAFYDALPQLIKKYESIYNDDRDRNYFLRMYLGDYRAADFLASRPDWDGKTLVLMGTSMGGQQSLCVAGLHPRVTHMIVHGPAGCDSNAALHRRWAGYPNWDASNPKVMETALYFDPVNFAPNIHATCLVSMGFLDDVAPPAGIWTAFNQIPGPKEVVPLVDAPHNHLATPEQQRAYTTRSAEWLAALVHGGDVRIRTR
jgi:cephalosporin-C deacetylase-like acetyl esterase